ncbi:MAG: Holliday junction resolvase RuvX [Minisyncoccia bacterium]
MKYIGIDYGHKRIGIALSDDSGLLARPLHVIESKNAIENIANTIEENNIDLIVIGESVNSSGVHNPIHTEAKQFVEILSTQTDVPHIFVKEFFSSVVARGNVGKEVFNARQEKKPQQGRADAKAAAVILQRYLDSLPR